MLKISLLALAVFAACQVDGGRLPTNKRFQRQEVLDSAPYPPSGFKPQGNGFELPNENELPEASSEQLDNTSELEEFNRLRSPVKSEKLVQGQIQTNVVSAPQPFVQQTSPLFAKIQAVQPFNTPFNYNAYQQPAFYQQQAFQHQQASVQQVNLSDKLQQSTPQLQQQIVPSSQQTIFQQPFVYSGQLQQPALFGAKLEQPTVIGTPQLQQPLVFGAQYQQPIVYNAQIQQPAVYGAQLQQPLFNGQLLQNSW
ncbi:hypothetical protein ACFFRR_010931 [Megaselia abdita]